MTSNPQIPESLKDLIDAYVANEIDEAGLRELEEQLTRDEAARAYFVRYCGLETDLHIMARARSAGAKAMRHIQETPPVEPEPLPARMISPAQRRAWTFGRAMAMAAALVIGVGLSIWLFSRNRPEPASAEVAWLINAQNCEWGDNSAGGGHWTGGGKLTMRRGLAEIRMASGATVVLEGPAEIELLSRNSLRLSHGRLAARVPDAAKGFQVVLPQGRVVDLGTEFGVSVAQGSSASDVVVFAGQVDAYGKSGGAKVSLTGSQAARINGEQVMLQASAGTVGAFARKIDLPPVVVPRRAVLDFRSTPANSLLDASGVGTGLTHRLPGTGEKVPANDPNLRVDTARGQLQLTTTRSDINRQFQIAEGEYLGLRLSDLGFTGSEDFEVSVVVPNIPSLAAVGQFGLYAGTRSDLNIRGGLISTNQAGQYRQFLVNNNGGRDTDAHYIGLAETGNDVRLTLRRQGGKYSLMLQNLTSGASSTLAIRHPEFLDNQREVFVGFFGANTGSEERRTLTIDELSATVWTLTRGGARP